MSQTKQREITAKQIEKTWDGFWCKNELANLIREVRDINKNSHHLGIRVHFPFVAKTLKSIPKHSPVLEAGCGLGHWVFYFQKRGFKSVGIDLAKGAIKTARKCAQKEGIKGCRFICADLRKIPFKDNYFDGLFSFGVIEHFKSPTPMLNEMRRVLSPKGRTLITVPNPYSLHTITRPLSKIFGKWQFGYERSYSPKTLKKILENHGFKVLEFGIMPGGEIFGTFPKYIPFIGNFLYDFLRKISFFIENRQSTFCFWTYAIAAKKL